MNTILLIAKLAVSLGLAILPIVVLVRDWKYHDRRTRIHHKITRAVILTWCGLSLITVCLVWIDALNARSLTSQIADLVDGKNKVIQQNKKLLATIDQYLQDLSVKDREIKALRKQTAAVQRGITSMYEFDGAKRTTTKPGHQNVDTSGRTVFKQMVELQENGSWRQLLVVCEKQMQERPEWLTPYLFAGAAHANWATNPRRLLILSAL